MTTRVRIANDPPRWYAKHVCRFRGHKFIRTGFQSRFPGGLMQLACSRCWLLFVSDVTFNMPLLWNQWWSDMASSDWETVDVDPNAPYVDTRIHPNTTVI